MLILLGRIACTECKDAAAYCYRCSLVCLSVCLSVTTVSSAETAGRIEMRFWVVDTGWPKEPCIGWGGADPPKEREQVWGLFPSLKCIRQC